MILHKSTIIHIAIDSQRWCNALCLLGILAGLKVPGHAWWGTRMELVVLDMGKV